MFYIECFCSFASGTGWEQPSPEAPSRASRRQEHTRPTARLYLSPSPSSARHEPHPGHRSRLSSPRGLAARPRLAQVVAPQQALQAPLRSRARPKTIGWRKSACEKERCAVSDGGVHGRYPARAAVAGSTLDGGQCGGRCRAPIHLASGEPRSVVVFCAVAPSDRIVLFG